EAHPRAGILKDIGFGDARIVLVCEAGIFYRAGAAVSDCTVDKGMVGVNYQTIIKGEIAGSIAPWFHKRDSCSISSDLPLSCLLKDKRRHWRIAHDIRVVFFYCSLRQCRSGCG